MVSGLFLLLAGGKRGPSVRSGRNSGRMVGQPEVGNSGLECCSVSDDERLVGTALPGSYGVVYSANWGGRLSASPLLLMADGKLMETASCPWNLMDTLVSASTASPFNS